MNRHQRRAQHARHPHQPQLVYAAPGTDNAAAMDVVCDADRDWFKANPDRTYRLRPISDAESTEVSQSLDVDLASYVVVKCLKPGLRVRAHFDAYPLNRVENFSDAACAMLFAEIETNNPRVQKIVNALSQMNGASQ